MREEGLLNLQTFNEACRAQVRSGHPERRVLCLISPPFAHRTGVSDRNTRNTRVLPAGGARLPGSAQPKAAELRGAALSSVLLTVAPYKCQQKDTVVVFRSDDGVAGPAGSSVFSLVKWVLLGTKSLCEPYEIGAKKSNPSPFQMFELRHRYDK